MAGNKTQTQAAADLLVQNIVFNRTSACSIKTKTFYVLIILTPEAHDSVVLAFHCRFVCLLDRERCNQIQRQRQRQGKLKDKVWFPWLIVVLRVRLSKVQSIPSKPPTANMPSPH